MKLSDLLKPKESISGAYAPGGFFNPQAGPLANKVLQTSINKSSPVFKQTTMNQSGTPVATDVITAPTVPTPEPIRDGKGNPIATPVDWYSEYAYRAQQGDTNAQDWMEQNYIDETQPANDGGIDFSTPTSGVAYSMEKLNELYGTKSPEELWALRQQLRINQAEQAQGWDQTQVDPNQPVQSLNDIRELLARQRSDAASGMLPNEGMDYRLPGMAGTPGYTFGDIQAINKSKADIFGTQISYLDKFMEDYSKGQKATSGTSSGYGTNPVISTLLASGKFTKEQSSAIKYAIDNGENPTAVILNNAKNIMGNTLGTKTGQLESAYTQMQGIDSLLKQFYANGGDSSFFRGNYEKVLNKLGSVSDPKLVNLASQISSILMTYRNATTGTAASVSEDAKINSIFPGIDKGEMLNNALTKARLSSVKREIDGNYRSALGSDYDTILKQQSGSNNTQNADGTTTVLKGGKKYKVYPDGSAEEIGFNQVGSGTKQAQKVVAGYDISSYATDPNHERSVATIYQRTPNFKSPTDIDMVIRQVAPKSRITGNMIAIAANTYGVDPKMVYAMMLQDSSLGTAGMGARNNNPGNIGQYDNLNRPVAGYNTLQGGVNAVAKWLSKKKVNQSKQNYA